MTKHEERIKAQRREQAIADVVVEENDRLLFTKELAMRIYASGKADPYKPEGESMENAISQADEFYYKWRNHEAKVKVITASKIAIINKGDA